MSFDPNIVNNLFYCKKFNARWSRLLLNSINKWIRLNIYYKTQLDAIEYLKSENNFIHLKSKLAVYSD